MTIVGIGTGQGAGGGGLARPSIPNATVPRRALLDRLRALDGERLVLVSAAAGSGKSALLASWVAELDEPVAWYGCTDADADPALFWGRLERSVTTAFAGHGVVGAEVLAEPAPGGRAEALTAQLATVVGPAVVVIDDLHLAGAEPRDLVALIATLPPTIRLVLATRVDPPFSLARMRVQGTLLELRQHDLRFDLAETELALAPFGLDLDEAALRQLHTATEGWPAGVTLVGISMRGRPDHAGALVELAARDRSLGDYLLSEVVEHQDAEVRAFLYATALLDAFDAALFDAATGRRDGTVLLERVRSANLFLVELDGAPDRYRYHHLVQEFLRLRFAAEDPDGCERVHRGAAAAHLARGDAGAALRHLLACGDLHEARGLLAREIVESGSILHDGGPAVARRWLAEHGEAQLAGDSSALLECTMALDVGGANEEAELWLRRWQAVETELAHEARVLLHGAWAFHHLVVGDPERSLAEAQVAQRLIAEAPVADGWRDSLPIIVLQAHLWLGDLDAVRAAVAEARRRTTSSSAVALVRLAAFEAAVDVAAGEVRRGDERAAAALAAADDLGLAELNFGRGEAELARAEAALDAARLDDVDRHLERALRIAEAGRPPLAVLSQLLEARLAAARGDLDGSLDALARARGGFRSPSTAVRARIDEVAADLALRRGDRRAAGDAVGRLPDGPGAAVRRARLALLEGDRAGAADALASQPQAMDLRGRVAHGIVAALVEPRVRRPEAIAALGEVAAAAADQRLLAPFVEAGPALWDLLAEVPATGAVAAFVEEVVEISRRVLPAAVVADQSGLIEPLSERELTVLRYLASRLDSSEIATALYVSVNTVRTHVKAIYRKLAVSSRPDAVARGRELGLL